MGYIHEGSWIYRGEVDMNELTLVFFLAIVVEKLVEILKDTVYAIPFLPDKFRPLTINLIRVWQLVYSWLFRQILILLSS